MPLDRLAEKRHYVGVVPPALGATGVSVGWLSRIFSDYRAGRTVGLVAFVAALCQYRSTDSRPVLNLWSYSWLFLIIVTGALAISSCFLPIIRRHRRTARPHAARDLFDGAIAMQGVAFFLMAADTPSKAGGITSFNLWAGSTPAAIATGWAALALLCMALVASIPRRFPRQRILVGAVFAALLLGEGVARVSVTFSPRIYGYGAISNEVWTRRFVSLNPLGFRDRNHPLQAAPGTRRVLILGDSLAYGWGITNPQDRFGEQLAATLTNRTQQPWEAINGSHPGTHTLQHEQYLQKMLQFDPDLICLLYVFNDIEYLQRGVEPPSVPARQPYKFLLSNSYLFGELFAFGRNIYLRSRGFQESAFGPGLGSPNLYLDDASLERHLKDLTRLVTAGRRNRASVWIVPFDPDLKSPRVDHRHYARFVDNARRSGLPILDPARAFDGFSYDKLIVGTLDRHPSALTNKLVAKEVADQLLSPANPYPFRASR